VAQPEAFDNEDNVIPPNPQNRSTSRFSSSDIAGDEAVGDEDMEIAEQEFGSNAGQVELPYIWSKVTHPPEGEESGRTKKVHLILQLLSGTHDRHGYAVECKPKSNSIKIVHQRELENIFWGPAAWARNGP
jgi:hypothetical protein